MIFIDITGAIKITKFQPDNSNFTRIKLGKNMIVNKPFTRAK
jgi:hypothetical protein